uniref:Uncharacterized protein n=1 Tax=Rhizophora mucronata TaxID=61149 RepID=A0A2P2LM55_RHIMU
MVLSCSWLQKFHISQYHTTKYHMSHSIFINITKFCTCVTRVCCRQMNTNVGLSCKVSTITKTILHNPRQYSLGRSKPSIPNICIATILFSQLNLLLKKPQASLH